MDIVVVDKLTKKFNGLTAVDHIDLSIKEGEIFGLLGPNGAGKTTTISMLCTLLKPTSGSALVNGFDVSTQRDDVRSSIGIAFQDPSIDDRLTGRENLRVHMGLYGVPRDERKKRMKEVLKLVELEKRADEPARNYSGGMRRRLEIARSLLHHPKVLFLDEPTIGLDPQTRAHIWDYIKKLAKQKNITILVTTHYMDEADSLCDRIAIIDEGKIVIVGTPRELKSAVGGDVVRVRSDEPEKLAKLIGGQVCDGDCKGDVLLTVKQGDKELPRVFNAARKARIRIESARVDQPSLNEVFLKFTGKEIREERADPFEHARTSFRVKHG
jgi:ABC-2 type transport system ATP-binding protein